LKLRSGGEAAGVINRGKEKRKKYYFNLKREHSSKGRCAKMKSFSSIVAAGKYIFELKNNFRRNYKTSNHYKILEQFAKDNLQLCKDSEVVSCHSIRLRQVITTGESLLKHCAAPAEATPIFMNLNKHFSKFQFDFLQFTKQFKISSNNADWYFSLIDYY
jgi:hypothetical protein